MHTPQHRTQVPPAEAFTFRRWYWIVTVLVMTALGYLTYYHWQQLGIPILRTR